MDSRGWRRRVCVRKTFPWTHTQRRRSSSLFFSLSTRSIRCATSTNSMESSFFARSDPVATTMRGGRCLWRCKLTNTSHPSDASMLDHTGPFPTLRDGYVLAIMDWLHRCSCVSKLSAEPNQGWARKCLCIHFVTSLDKKLLTKSDFIRAATNLCKKYLQIQRFVYNLKRKSGLFYTKPRSWFHPASINVSLDSRNFESNSVKSLITLEMETWIPCVDSGLQIILKNGTWRPLMVSWWELASVIPSSDAGVQFLENWRYSIHSTNLCEVMSHLNTMQRFFSLITVTLTRNITSYLISSPITNKGSGIIWAILWNSPPVMILNWRPCVQFQARWPGDNWDQSSHDFLLFIWRSIDFRLP